MSETSSVSMPMDTYGSINGGSSSDRAKLMPTKSRPDEPEACDDGVGDRGLGLLAQSRSQRRLESGCYFADGVRRVDFVIVWEEDLQRADDDPEDPWEQRKAVYRRRFEGNLRKVGVQMEEETSTSEKKKIHFIKLFVPWDVMCYYAEDLCLRAPLQAHSHPADNWSGKVLKSLHIPNVMEQRVPNQPLDYYTCPFRKSKLSKFLGSDDQDTYFSSTQRHQVAYEILATQVYGKRKRAEVGIDRLLEEEVYSGAFPLHEGPYELPKDYQPEDLNARQILNAYWAKWGLWYKYQPLDHIREYYGEKIGLYFAWLGLYTAWLLPASIVGIIVFLYGCFTFKANVPGNEVCDSNMTYKMCPLCDEAIGCKYWYLSDICMFMRISYLFDHPGTVFYSVFVAFWAVTFLENWKRKNASLAHHWDVMDFEEDEERPRPEYSALCSSYERNPVTGNLEPHFPNSLRIPRIITGITCIIIMMVIVVIFIIAVIIYRVLIAIPLFQNPLLRSQASTVASGSAAIVNLILIMSLGKVYEKLAYKLTQWEMHRTQTEFEDQLILKVFIFQFVNFYSSIFYIAFFKGKFTGYPGRYIKFFGLRNEECDNGGCLIELAQQLAVIMIGKQIINNCQEVFLPKLFTWIHRFTKGLNWSRSQEAEASRCQADYQLIPYEGLFEEYLEMVLQFGFITIFVAAFPLAPFFALLNNWLEIRLDASKLVCETRRPVSERAQDIGVWFTLLDVIVQLSVISNAFLIAFTSEFLPKELYKYQFDSELHGYTNFTLAWSPANSTAQPCRYKAFRGEDGHYTMFYWKLLAVRLAFVIVFEHVVFFISRMLDILIPDVPEVLQVKIKREQYLAKQALMDAETLQSQRLQLQTDAEALVGGDSVARA
ncbi:hypothetical protein BOX15_Mlig021551g3 [Macrostomum lignano]|uniref:Anoctamin n=2 Tax=Macrostomum lignano TaxID=282301 RepID=A0A267H1A6_9PLAT|nr:hypothetical protein BOX15_Mlig021551g3 [Macrostomum lignano]